MSIAMTAAVWELDLPLAWKIVLLKLSDCSDDKGRIHAFAVGKLARQCSLSSGSLKEVLGKLVERRVLRIENFKSADLRDIVYSLDVDTTLGFDLGKMKRQA